MKNLSIIIVSYNTRQILCDCIESIKIQLGLDSRVIVVDNASKDGSFEMVQTNFPWVKAIANTKNLGFAKANNMALPHCLGEYIFFLNPDTVIHPHTMENAISYMNRERNVGLAGVHLFKTDGTTQESIEKGYPRQKYDKHKMLLFDSLKGEIAWVVGAGMIARKDVILDVGGFDEDFFLYAEEADLCLRIRQAGWKIGYIEDARITHLNGQSEKQNPPVAVWEKKYKAEILFMKKHYSVDALLSSLKANRREAIYRIITLQLTIPFFHGQKRIGMLNKLDNYRCLLRLTKNMQIH